MRSIIFLLYFIIVPKFFFAQIIEKFHYLDSNENTINLDFSKESTKLNSKKRILIYGFIFDRALELTNKAETEYWILPYKLSKIETHFFFFDLKSSSGYGINLLNHSKTEPLKYKRSTLFILTKDSLINEELKSLQTELSLTIKSKLSFIENNEIISVYQLENTHDFSDFKWKTNQLLYNLDKIDEPVKLPEKRSSEYLFQLGLENSIFALQKNAFTDFYNYQLELNVLKQIHVNKKLKMFLGFGGSVSNYSFRSVENSLTGFKSEQGSPLDSIYCAINDLEEKFNFQNFKVNLCYIISRDLNYKNSIQFGLIPYLSFVNRINSTITLGSITTYGTNSQINEYIYNIPKLGLVTRSGDQLKNQSIEYNVLNFGCNARFSYSRSLGEFSINPFVGLQLDVFRNKNKKDSSFSISEGIYFGSFSIQRNVSSLSPTIGISIIF
jgi:hypothetical protein